MRPKRGHRTGRCPECGLPASTSQEPCLCARLPRVENRTAITILVHFCEIKKPSNTARLAARLLSRCGLLLVGVPPAEPAPADFAGRDVAESLARLDPERTLLLYPSDDAASLDDLPQRDPRTPYELLVPDGTWAETRRLVRRYPRLKQLRAVRLQNKQSLYALRRNPVPGLLCTLEAIAAALGVLDDHRVEANLLEAFGAWQAQALAHRQGRAPSPAQPAAQFER